MSGAEDRLGLVEAIEEREHPTMGGDGVRRVRRLGGLGRQPARRILERRGVLDTAPLQPDLLQQAEGAGVRRCVLDQLTQRPLGLVDQPAPGLFLGIHPAEQVARRDAIAQLADDGAGLWSIAECLVGLDQPLVRPLVEGIEALRPSEQSGRLHAVARDQRQLRREQQGRETVYYKHMKKPTIA